MCRDDWATRRVAKPATSGRGRGRSEGLCPESHRYRSMIWTMAFEISNETGDYSTAWQYDLINYIHTYEARKPKQTPGLVGR